MPDRAAPRPSRPRGAGIRATARLALRVGLGLGLAPLAGLTACAPPCPDAQDAQDAQDAVARRGPPPAHRDDIVEVIHGRRIADPYRWLESDDDPLVQAWVDAQDEHAQRTLAASPGQAELREALRRQWDREGMLGPVILRAGRYFYARRHRGRDKAVYYVREGLHGPERLLLDPATLSRDGSLGVPAIHPSPDGKRVAYRVSRNNADQATLRILDVDTGRDLPDVIHSARFASPQWTPDGASFYYTGLPPDPDMDPVVSTGLAEVRHHRLGQPVADDEVLFGPLHDARTYLRPRLIFGGRGLLLHVSHGSAGPVDLYLADLEAGTGLQPLLVGADALTDAVGYRGKLYLLTSDGAPRFRVVEVDPARPSRADWREVVAERDQTLQQAALMKGHLVLSYLDDVNPHVEILRLRDGRRWPVDLPPVGAVSQIWTDPREREALLAFGSLAERPVIYRVPLPPDTLATVAPQVFWAAAPTPADDDAPVELVMQQRFAVSRDGTRVPLFVMHRRGLPPGPHPTVLNAYGGFGIPVTPGYNPVAEQWARRGGVWAVASLRGGGEYGEAWHRAGTRTNKQRVFEDFIAAAQDLVDAGITTPSGLGILGGSNGGLLVGAVSTQRPDLFGAVVCMVPLLDMVRSERFGLGPLWIDEYGSAEDPAQLRALHDYSPYHRIHPGVTYPPLLMMSADSDDRVHPLHARKFVAAMQHATAGQAAPILLRTQAQAGHGGPDSLPARIDMFADVLSFFVHELSPQREQSAGHEPSAGPELSVGQYAG